MKVGNIYVDLEIPELQLKEFLEPTDCYALEIVETAGTSLPTALMVFKAKDDKVINGINENTSVIIRIGDSAENCDSYTVYPQIVRPHRNSEDDTWVVEFGGFIGGREYMIDQKSEAIKGTSLDVIKSIYATDQIETNITKTQENEVDWRLVNETYCQFAIDTILHMDIRPSFPLVGIDKNGKMYLRDFEKLVKSPIRAYFVPYEPQKENCFQYINNFNVESYKPAYDLFAGFNRITQVTKSESGEQSNVVSTNTPVIAASKISEKTEAGINQTLNVLQSDNVHKTFTEAYVYNTNRLVSLSSIVGEVLLSGYFRNVAPTDIVYVVDNGKVGQVLTGAYIVDTISSVVNFSAGTVLTRVYVTRDNKNNVENYTPKQKGVIVLSDIIQRLANAISNLRVAYAFCKEIIDGTYLNSVLSWGLEVKRDLLRIFSVAGVNIDFNSQADLIRSLVLTGNSLMNTLTDMLFPEQIATVLRDFIINKPSLIGIVGSYVSQYVPSDLQSAIMKLLESMFHVSDSLNSVVKDNNIAIGLASLQALNKGKSTINNEEESMEQEVSPEQLTISEGQERANEIIGVLEERASELDIPFPIIEITESQSLYSNEDLTNYIIDETISNLESLGYIGEKDEDKIRAVLQGTASIETKADLVTIIKNNTGNNYNYRYWGTFGATKDALYAWTCEDDLVYTKTETVTGKTRLYNANYSPYLPLVQDDIFEVTEVGETQRYIITKDGEEAVRAEGEDIIPNALLELTSFKIKDSYKDKYKNLPCTKLINATNNQRIFFACPKRETDVYFYINSKRIELPSFEVDLGNSDRSILYTVYYTISGYNSNSVIFEVKKGGIL